MRQLTPIEKTFLLFPDEALALLDAANRAKHNGGRSPCFIARWLAEEFREEELKNLRSIRTDVKLAHDKVKAASAPLYAAEDKYLAAVKALVKP